LTEFHYLPLQYCTGPTNVTVHNLIHKIGIGIAQS